MSIKRAACFLILGEEKAYLNPPNIQQVVKNLRFIGLVENNMVLLYPLYCLKMGRHQRWSGAPARRNIKDDAILLN